MLKKTNYTREDFRTDKPYKFVYENSRDQLRGEEIMQLVSENAKKVGFDNFEKVYKGYLHSVEMTNLYKSLAQQNRKKQRCCKKIITGRNR